MPEGFYPLAHATLYLATAPKSNTVGRAYGAALADVESTRNDPVPLHLRNAPTRLMKHLGYGSGTVRARRLRRDGAEATRRRRSCCSRTAEACRAAYFNPATGDEARCALDRARRVVDEDPFPE